VLLRHISSKDDYTKRKQTHLVYQKRAGHLKIGLIKYNPRAKQLQVADHFITSQEFVFALNDDNMLMIHKDFYIDPDIRLIISEFVKT